MFRQKSPKPWLRHTTLRSQCCVCPLDKRSPLTLRYSPNRGAAKLAVAHTLAALIPVWLRCSVVCRSRWAAESQSVRSAEIPFGASETHSQGRVKRGSCPSASEFCPAALGEHRSGPAGCSSGAWFLLVAFLSMEGLMPQRPWMAVSGFSREKKSYSPEGAKQGGRPSNGKDMDLIPAENSLFSFTVRSLHKLIKDLLLCLPS